MLYKKLLAAGFLILFLSTAYYVLRFPFGVNLETVAGDIGDLYWNPVQGSERHRFEVMKKKSRERIKKELFEIKDVSGMTGIMKIADWVHQRLNFGCPSPDTDWNPFDILSRSERGEGFFCDEYSALFVEIAQANGIPARVFSVLTMEEKGHFIAEAWLAARQKWVMVDAMYNLYVHRQGVPLSIAELYLQMKADPEAMEVRQGRVKDEQFTRTKQYLRVFDIKRLSLLMRNDFLDRPNSFRGLIFSSPQRLVNYYPDRNEGLPFTEGEIKKTRIKILLLMILALTAGMTWGVYIISRRTKE